MTFEDFTEAMLMMTRESVGDSVEVRKTEVTKNNGVKYVGLVFISPGYDASPTIYLENFYRLYLEGTSVEEIEKQLIACYQNAVPIENDMIAMLEDYESMRSHIVGRLVSREMNEELLTEAPHLAWNDLIEVFYLFLGQAEEANAMVLIHNELAERWGVTKEEIIEAARENGPRMLPCEELDISLPFRVYTNSRRTYGAGVILYDGVLGEIREELGEDFYIVPSSVHEVLVLPDSDVQDGDSLRRVLRDVNRTVLEKEEFLSDELYHFSGEIGEAMIV